MAVQYLFKSRDPGILQFLGNRLFELNPTDLDFYLPQLLILYLYTEAATRNCIHPYLVKRCKGTKGLTLYELFYGVLYAAYILMDTIDENII